MPSRLTAVLLLLAATVTAGQQAPPSTPTPIIPCKDRSVDEYLAEIHKHQRNKNPLPSDVCIFAFCPHAGRPQSGEIPPAAHGSPAPPEKTPAGESSSQAGNAGAGADLRGTSLYDPLASARNVDAGDYYFSRQNYRAALSRFQEALEDKPDDAAIQQRLGRTCEKLDDPAEAYQHFDAALILSPDGPGAKQAREALERLRPRLAQAGVDPDAIHSRNAAAIAASCPAASP